MKCSVEGCTSKVDVAIFELDELFCNDHAEEIIAKHRNWHVYDFKR